MIVLVGASMGDAGEYPHVGFPFSTWRGPTLGKNVWNCIDAKDSRPTLQNTRPRRGSSHAEDISPSVTRQKRPLLGASAGL